MWNGLPVNLQAQDGLLCDELFLLPDHGLHLLWQPLQCLHKFAVFLVSIVQRDFHLIQICLYLLLEPKCLYLALGLHLQAGLQRLDCPLVVLPASPSREVLGILGPLFSLY